MARITSIAKGSYYPFVPSSIPAVISMFQPSGKGGIALDPCAGEGEALAALAQGLKLTPYANELDNERAEACRERFGISQAVQGDLLTLRMPHNSVIFQWVNPPYTENKDGDERRREFEHLKHAWQWTQVGGFTLWVVYAMHMTERAARWLLTHSSIVDVYRVPGLHMATYPQIVVVTRKAGDNREPTVAEVDALVESCKNPDTLPQLEVLPEPRYRLPEPVKVRRFYFHPDKIMPDMILPALEQFGVQNLASFQAVVAPPSPPPPMTPIVPPRGGQIGLILAAGIFDGLILDLPEGEAAVRGVVRMVEINTTPPEMIGIRETYEIRPQVTITLLHRDGKVKAIAGEDQVALVSFLKENRQAFLRHIDENTTPIYQFDYHHLDDVFARVFRNRPIPGRPTIGLFETQRHVVASVYAALQHRKGILLSGEMGVGKSAIGAAVIGALHGKGQMKSGEIALVLCPPHLTLKWEREMRDAVPGCVVQVLTDVDDTVAFMKKAETNPNQLHVAVLSRERSKLGEGWEPAFVVRKEHVAQWPKGSQPPVRLNGQERVVTLTHLHCPTCGKQIPTRKDGFGEASVAWLKQQPRFCMNMIQEKAADGSVISERRCDGPLWHLKRRWSAPKPGEKFPQRNPRYPLAQFIRQRYPNRIGILIGDEIHEAKSGGSDQGKAMQDLMLVARKAIGMTGTLFGGKASTVFWLEWAVNPRMYTSYPLKEGRTVAINRWVRATGVLERVVEFKESEAASGTYTTNRRIDYAPQEAPGISPRLVAELLDHTVWVSLSDLNFALPDYEEIPVAVSLPNDVQSEYDRAKKRLLEYLLDLRNEGDASFMSTYLQAVLRYPSSCFREKSVIHKRAGVDEHGNPVDRLVTVMKGFGADRTYPKEEELVRLVREELEEGRRCVIFVAQTGELDIQPRLEEILKTVPGAKPFILRAQSPETDQRDTYVEKYVQKGYNILITNPRLVQTGMDLIAFPTLIFAEADYSLYVMSQASRRAWRIGQTQPCRTYYLFYADTMEEQAIALISKKQAAAALLGGDADGGGLAQLSGGSNSLLSELAKTIASDSAVVDVTQLFKRQAEQSEDFTSGWAQNWANGGSAQPVETKVIPLDNVIGQRYYDGKYAFTVIDYGPLTEAKYLVRKDADGTTALCDSNAVLRALKFHPARPDAPAMRQTQATSPAKPQGQMALGEGKAAASQKPATTTASPDTRQTKSDIGVVYQQHQTLKKQFPKAIILIRMGDFLETFDADAALIAEKLDIVLSSRNLDPKTRVPMAGIPAHAADKYLKSMVDQGLKVAVVEPTSAKKPAQDNQTPAASQQTKARASTAATAKPTSPAKSQAKGAGRAAQPSLPVSTTPQAAHPHSDLVGKTFIDPEDRVVKVLGADDLFPATHLKIEREGKNYSIAAEKLRAFTPAKPEDAPAAPKPPHKPAESVDQALTQFRAVKPQHTSALTFVEMEAVWVTFEEDALAAAKVLKLPVKVLSIPGLVGTRYASMSKGQRAEYVEQLLQKGHRVALANGSIELLEPDPNAKPPSGKGAGAAKRDNSKGSKSEKSKSQNKAGSIAKQELQPALF